MTAMANDESRFAGARSNFNETSARHSRTSPCAVLSCPHSPRCRPSTPQSPTSRETAACALLVPRYNLPTRPRSLLDPRPRAQNDSPWSTLATTSALSSAPSSDLPADRGVAHEHRRPAPLRGMAANVIHLAQYACDYNLSRQRR